jgi:hypothetical protein
MTEKDEHFSFFRGMSLSFEARSAKEAIESMRRGVQELDVDGLGIDDALAEEIKVNRTVRMLSFLGSSPGCKIGDEGARTLAEALKVNFTLEKISLANNWIGEAGASDLAGSLKVSATLTELNLGRNRIGVGGARAVAEALKGQHRP